MEGVASLFDITGDLVNPRYYLTSCGYDVIEKDFAADYTRILKDYSQAVNKVVQRSQEK